MAAYTRAFEEFITEILRRGKISDKTLKKVLDPLSLEKFLTAFTHPTYDKENNYEYFEFRGDTILNTASAVYIRKRFPKIVSVRWLTTIKHKIIGKEFLAKVAENAGYRDFIRYGDEIKEILRTKEWEISKEYQSMMEDVFEAVIGVIVEIFDSKFKRGVGYAVAYKVIESLFSDELHDFSLDWEDVFDVKTRLKEVYDSVGWSLDANIRTKTLHGSKSTTTIYGYVRGDRTVKPENKVVLATSSGDTLQISEGYACFAALRLLRERYGIIENPIDPYNLDDQRHTSNTIELDKSFKKFIKRLLKIAKVKKDAVEILTDEVHLIEFREAFVHKSYSPQNQNLLKFLGITVSDACVIDYLSLRFPDITSEKWLTNLKHNIVSGDTFFNFAKKYKFDRYILNSGVIMDDKTSESYKNVMTSTVKALIGAIVTVVDAEKTRGVGYAVAFNLLERYLSSTEISLKYEDVFDSKSRLKEIYDRYRWKLKSSTEYSYDEESKIYTAKIYAYPLGNKRQNPENKKFIASGEGRKKIIAEQEAAGKALNVLKKTYKIREIQINPYCEY